MGSATILLAGVVHHLEGLQGLGHAEGRWRNLPECFNSAGDVSPPAAQMPRLVGLSYASVLYRSLAELGSLKGFSQAGNEIAWGTIGNAAAAQGLFWESLNAIGVL